MVDENIFYALSSSFTHSSKQLLSFERLDKNWVFRYYCVSLFCLAKLCIMMLPFMWPFGFMEQNCLLFLFSLLLLRGCPIYKVFSFLSILQNYIAQFPSMPTPLSSPSSGLIPPLYSNLHQLPPVLDFMFSLIKSLVMQDFVQQGIVDVRYIFSFYVSEYFPPMDSEAISSFTLILLLLRFFF